MRLKTLLHGWPEMRVTAAGYVGVALLAGTMVAQGPPPSRPPAPKPNESTDPLLRGFEFRSIGPAVMMGRLDDIQGSTKDPMLVYIGFATGVFGNRPMAGTIGNPSSTILRMNR